ncbi:hypothetical protein LZ31DRAFT_216641 [Colletotrichum somersetense]|nr:hypothetical protein LZ31DRAFT_216641 [Colletotrichum somersetense]
MGLQVSRYTQNTKSHTPHFWNTGGKGGGARNSNLSSLGGQLRRTAPARTDAASCCEPIETGSRGDQRMHDGAWRHVRRQYKCRHRYLPSGRLCVHKEDQRSIGDEPRIFNSSRSCIRTNACPNKSIRMVRPRAAEDTEDAAETGGKPRLSSSAVGTWGLEGFF